ncbi:MAG TPA: CpsB/CapC family capsule biosynthesis tyrosine phosphatase [Bacteroidia bacterium]|jgi:tyrosine-protein phosphatase YwqE|nr:CpsB/CapC family capsule biosynthesis tyrosine phosphatase [Bacteroidia bacterium]
MGILNLFKKKNNLLDIPVDLSILGTDIHSHFIPGIDDGSKTIEESVEMLTEMYNLGYKKIITTPHIMGDFYRNTPEIILSGLEKVKAALKAANIPLEMEGSAEYYLDFDLERKLDNGELLPFGDNYILFEISYMNAPENLIHFIFKLQTMGYKPILAHPERYNFWHNNFEKYEDLADKGVKLQLNINSLTGYYSLGTKKIAELMIEKNLISFIGTDCHHMGHINLIKNVVKEPYLKKLIESGKLLNNTL